ncbi:MAG: alpha/beta fold hydrolase [Balneola sp.]|nr:MAG: alpha/beta fold hydrolase [Balneola sp.]
MKFIFSVGLMLISSVAFGQDHRGFVPKFTVSEKTTHKIPNGQEFTFGYLEVLENRNSPNSRTIQIPVYVFKSRSPNPKQDPIVYTVGGPGSTTMPSAQYMNYYKYLDDRDFILVEQRGTLYAKPHLDCPEWSNATHKAILTNLDTETSKSLFEEAAQACKSRLEKSGIDLDSYNTLESAADIHELVDVLGIEEYNLLTISYSTKIAQVLLRDYPEKIRSVVMDSPLPLEANYDEESVINLLTVLYKLLSDCEDQEPCNNAFPDIKNHFRNYLISKTESPVEITITDPATGNPRTFRLSGKDLIAVFTLASSGAIRNVPFEINKLINGDLSSVEKQLSYLFEEPATGAGIGMRLSVWCSEESPFVDPLIVEKEKSIHPEVKGLSPAVFESSICNIWDVSGMPIEENEAIESATPVLLISGEYDNETPTKWAEQMSENLSNSFHFVFKGWKHTPTTNWANRCAMNVANDFFNNPNVRPNPDCLKEIESPIFKTNSP